MTTVTDPDIRRKTVGPKNVHCVKRTKRITENQAGHEPIDTEVGLEGAGPQVRAKKEPPPKMTRRKVEQC